MHTALLALILLFATGDNKPSVSTTTPKDGEKPKAASIGKVELKARCTSCVQKVEGKLTVAGSGIHFCCTSAIALEANSKVKAKCPYSFDLAADELREQYAEPGVWHVVTKSGEHYAFASEQQASIDHAYAALQKIAADLEKSRLLENAEAAEFLAKLKKPELAAGESCP